MDENLTTQARLVMALAGAVAAKWYHEYLGTEHILFALVEEREKPNRAVRVLAEFGIDPKRITVDVEKLIRKGPEPTSFIKKFPLTPRAKKVLEYADEEARNHHLQDVSTEYLLMGLLREQDGVAAQVLMNLDLRFEAVREAILRLNDEDRDSAPASSPAPVATSRKDSLERIADTLEEISVSLKRLASLADVEE